MSLANDAEVVRLRAELDAVLDELVARVAERDELAARVVALEAALDDPEGDSAALAAILDDGGGSTLLCTCRGIDTGKHEDWCNYVGRDEDGG